MTSHPTKVNDEMVSHPTIRNDEMAAVAFGRNGYRNGCANLFYCGRRLGGEAIPDSDGRCGPTNGPQCKSCQRLQVKPGIRLEVLGLQFPSLNQQVLVAALRKNGGSIWEAAKFLEDLGATCVPVNTAMPGSYSRVIDVDPVPPLQVNNEVVEQVMEICAREKEEVEAAFRECDGASKEEVIEYVLSNPREELQSLVKVLADREEAFMNAVAEFNTKRENILREASLAEVPEAVLNLGQSRPTSTEHVPDLTAASGHLLVPYDDRNLDGQPVPAACIVCDCELQNSLHCPTCGLCETCVRQRIVFFCPLMRNGGHLHHHPLSHLPYGKRMHCVCDVNGKGCKKTGNSIRWHCLFGCDFDICSECMSQEAPEGWHSRTQYVQGVEVESTSREEYEEEYEQEEEEENETLQDDIGFDTVDPQNLELETGVAVNNLTQDFAQCIPVNSVDFAERLAASMWEGPFLQPPLVTADKKEVRKLRGLVHSPRNTKPLENKAKDALQSFAKKNQDSKKVSACEIQTIENLLRLGQNTMIGNGYGAFCKAISNRRVDIGAMYLFAHAYAPKREKNFWCYCGDEIKTTDGAVGCLNGHAMHPGCAADLLLGGDSCPMCHDPICFPNLPQAEVKAAAKYLEVDQEKRREIERVKLEKERKELEIQGDNYTFRVNDIVRISPDQASCSKEAMKRPKAAGWSKDMEFACGLEGCVTEIVEIDDGGAQIQVAIRVLTKKSSHQFESCNRSFTCVVCSTAVCVHCQKCPTCTQDSDEWSRSCPKSRVSWFWPPSVLIPLSREDTSILYKNCLRNKNIVALSEAENHVFCLRAELKAIINSRVANRVEFEKKETTLRNELISGLSGEETALLSNLFGKISFPDLYRARHLLTLTIGWDETQTGTFERKRFVGFLREGEIDSAARVVRRYNAARIIDKCQWQDATSERMEYLLDAAVPVALYSSPSLSAPRTGYYIQPWARFFGKVELVAEEDGEQWVLVDGNPFFDQAAFKGLVRTDQIDWRLEQALPGAIVRRGRDWESGDADGGKENVGIIRSIPEPGKITVRWEKSGRSKTYKAGCDKKFDLEFVAPPPPPPQGWICAKPVMASSTSSILQRGRSSLRCFSCGDGLEAPCQMPRNYQPLETSNSVREGDVLLLARTLAPVVVTGLDLDADRISCSFQTDHSLQRKKQRILGGWNNCTSFSAWHRPEDLLRPVCSKTPDYCANQQWFSRACDLQQTAGGSWSLVFSGCSGEGIPKDNTRNGSAVATVEEKPAVRVEKPFIAIDTEGNYELHIPKPTTTIGAQLDGNNNEIRSFSNVKVGKPILPMKDGRYVNHSDDTYNELSEEDEKITLDLQRALDEGKDLVLCPGVFFLTTSLVVKYTNQVILGLGLSTLVAPQDGSPCIKVMPKLAGVRIAGLVLEASVQQDTSGRDSDDKSCLLSVGDLNTLDDAGDAMNPVTLSDIFTRVGGSNLDRSVETDIMVRIHSGNVVGDNLWLWRADHVRLRPGEKPNDPALDLYHQVGWKRSEECCWSWRWGPKKSHFIRIDECVTKNAIEILGNDVKMYGLFCEHAYEHQCIWKGERGSTTFFQCELPYDWDTEFANRNYTGYYVGKDVLNHNAKAIGVYCNFRAFEVKARSGMHFPTRVGVVLQNPFTVFLDNKGAIENIVDLNGLLVGGSASIHNKATPERAWIGRIQY